MPAHKPTAKSVRKCWVNFVAVSRLMANLTSHVNKHWAMLDNQGFCRADPHIICIKIFHDHCHIEGALSPMREFREAGWVSWIQNANMFGQLFILWNHEKGYQSKLSILWTTRLSSSSLRFSKLTVLLWIMASFAPHITCWSWSVLT